MKRAIVLAPGPSAETYWPLVREEYPDAPVITCNGGIRLCEKPDAYCIFENSVIKKYGRQAIKLAQSGVDVWTTEDRVEVLNVDHPRIIGNEFVFTRPDRGNYWMTTGVMCILVASLEWHPDEIHWLGIDGFEKNVPMHAKGVDPEDLIAPDDFDAEAQNLVASEYIAKITNHEGFSDIDYYCYGTPIHPDQDKWRVKYRISEARRYG